jgi:hypothetical protein
LVVCVPISDIVTSWIFLARAGRYVRAPVAALSERAGFR